MHKLSLLAAPVVALLLIGAASAANVRDTRGGGQVAEGGSSSTDRMAEPFSGGVVMIRAKPSPYPCYVEMGEDGELHVLVKNASGKSYPAGTTVKIKFSNGKYIDELFEGPWPVNGEIGGTLLFWTGPLTCSVEVIPVHPEIDELLAKLR